jgi:hypothetical protein
MPKPQPSSPAAEPEEPRTGSAGRAAWRWLAIWTLLTAVYAAAGFAYRALTAAVPPVRAEDLAHWGIVPGIQTAALALVARLRRKP